MEKNNLIAICCIAICLTIMASGLMLKVYHTDMECIKNGYTKSTLPGADCVYWVKH